MAMASKIDGHSTYYLIYVIKEIKEEQEVEGSHPNEKSRLLPQSGLSQFSIPEPNN